MPPAATADTVLVAHRGEGALRVLRSARAHGLRTVGVHAADAADDEHLRAADVVAALPGAGERAFADHGAVLDVAMAHGADLVHPGYGPLADDPGFVDACADRGVTFVGPDAGVLARIADKAAARDAARAAGLRTLPGTAAPTNPEQVRRFLERHPDGLMLKPVHGRHGRGLEAVRHASDVDAAFARCTAEAEAVSGSGALYAERLVDWARHVEVQVVGAPLVPGGSATRALALGDRDASVQRDHQPLLEIAPAPQLRDGVRRRLHAAAARMAADVGLRGIATVEVLVAGDEFVFGEVGAGLHAGYTVTEAVTGVDLVVTQLDIARGAVFDDLALPAGVVVDGGPATGDVDDDGDRVSGVPHRPEGIAVEVHVRAERVRPDGGAERTAGTISAFEPPHGAGIRVESRARPGLVVGADDETQVATLVTAVRGDSLPGTAERCAQALDDLELAGVVTNKALLLSILRDRELGEGTVGTDYLDRRLPDLLATAAAHEPEPAAEPEPSPQPEPAPEPAPRAHPHRAEGAWPVDGPAPVADAGELVLLADEDAVVAELAPPGTAVGAGEPVALLTGPDGRQQVVTAPAALVVATPRVRRGQTVAPGDPVLGYHVAEQDGIAVGILVDAPIDEPAPGPALDPEDTGPTTELRAVLRHREATTDAAHGRHVAARHAAGRGTVRENLARLLDEGSLVEVGPLAGSGSTRPGGGLVAGTGCIGPDSARVTVLAWDEPDAAADPVSSAPPASDAAEAKTARVLAAAGRALTPVVLLLDGDGTSGRPPLLRSGLLEELARLRGRVPLVAVVTGTCGADRAAAVGLCDVVVATPAAQVHVSAGGHAPTDDPAGALGRTGLVHLLAADDVEATSVARDVVTRLRGDVLTAAHPAPSPGAPRWHALLGDGDGGPEPVALAATLADPGSVLELGAAHAPTLRTFLVRVDGRSLGVAVVTSSAPDVGGPAADGLDKLTAFAGTCDAHDLPLLSFVDVASWEDAGTGTGVVVPALGRLLAARAHHTSPRGVVVLGRAHGPAAVATGVGDPAAAFTIAWPGAVLGAEPVEQRVGRVHEAELASEPDADRRADLMAKLVAESRQQVGALAAAEALVVDDVVDPADTPTWVRRHLLAPTARPSLLHP